MRLHILTAALFSSAVSLTATNPLTITASPARSFAPTTLTIRVQVEPDADNRELEVVAEPSAYYRSSRLPLEGAGAPADKGKEHRLRRTESLPLQSDTRTSPLAVTHAHRYKVSRRGSELRERPGGLVVA